MPGQWPVNPVAGAEGNFGPFAPPKAVKGLRPRQAIRNSMGDWSMASRHPRGRNMASRRTSTTARKSMTLDRAPPNVKMETADPAAASPIVLKSKGRPCSTGEIIDSMFHEQERALCAFYEEADGKTAPQKNRRDVSRCTSRATMMKVLPPPIVLRPRGGASFYKGSLRRSTAKLFRRAGA